MNWVEMYFQMKVISELVIGGFFLLLILLFVVGSALEVVENKLHKIRKGKRK